MRIMVPTSKIPSVYAAVPVDENLSQQPDELFSAPTDLSTDDEDEHEEETPFVRMKEDIEEMNTKILTTSSLKVLSFATGSLIAILSQCVLLYTLWDPTIFTKTTSQVLIFSMIWSFWTCLMVFAALYISMALLQRRQDMADDFIFMCEAHHVTGALVSITALWMLYDVWQVQHHAQPAMHAVFVGAAIVAYGLVVHWVATNKNCQCTDEQPLEPTFGTFLLLAGVTGFITGAGSQWGLAWSLWGGLTRPVTTNLVVFSGLWSILTVAVTILGYWSLRHATMVSTPTVMDSVHQYRLLLRMEAVYVSACLAGICAAWLVLDWQLSMTDQMIPSLGMLFVSLAALRGILYLFPEEDCLREVEEEQSKVTTVLQV